MLRSIRKWGYTLLSRHFYIGIGVGFFLAGLLSVNLAHAETVEVVAENASTTYNTRSLYRLGQYVDCSSFSSNTITAIEFLHLGASSINTTAYAVVNDTSTSTGVSITTANYPSGRPQLVKYTFSTPVDITSVCNSTSTVTITYDNTSGGAIFPIGCSPYQFDGGTTDTNVTDTRCRSLIFRVYGEVPTATGGVTTTVFYPLGLNAIIDDMNCVNSATGTDCTFQYASSTVDVTPGNLLIFTTILLGAMFLTMFLIRKLT